MAETPSVIVIGNDPMVLRLPSRLQADGIQTVVARSISDVREASERFSHRVALVDGDQPKEQLDQIEGVLRSHPPVPTLTVVSPADYVRLVSSLQSGSEFEYAPKPSRLDELALRVKALILRAGYELPATSAQQEPAGYRASNSSHTGRLVSLFAAKGGVGKSTIAANLAVGLSQFFSHRVLLVDANLWFGDIGFLLDIVSRKSIFDLCSGDEPDVVSLSEAIARHSSGVHVLLRPSDLVSVEKIDVRALTRALAIARTTYDIILVDLPTTLDEMTLEILDGSDQILVITTPEVSAIANTSRFVTIADDLGYKGRLSLVVNRANTGIDLDSIARTLNLDVACTLVSAGVQMVQAANEGVTMFSKYAEGSPIVKDLLNIVERVAGRKRVKGNEPENQSDRRAYRPMLMNLLADRLAAG